VITTARRKSLPKPRKPVIWDLWLYVADENQQSMRAFQNLKNACEEHVSGRYHIKVVDVLTHPEIGTIKLWRCPLWYAGVRGRFEPESAT